MVNTMSRVNKMYNALKNSLRNDVIYHFRVNSCSQYHCHSPTIQCCIFQTYILTNLGVYSYFACVIRLGISSSDCILLSLIDISCWYAAFIISLTAVRLCFS